VDPIAERGGNRSRRTMRALQKGVLFCCHGDSVSHLASLIVLIILLP
jgi:hypothetical protein